MQRAHFLAHIAAGTLLADLGIWFWYQAAASHGLSWTTFALGLSALGVGYNHIGKSVHSLEISEYFLTYQTAGKIVRVPWHQVTDYIFDGQRFVAYDKSRGEILLDIDLEPNDDWAWPAHEQKQIVAFIQRKMQEVGARRESLISLRYNYQLKVKP